MGPSLLLQWTVQSPPSNLSDIILLRLLEHYSLSQPLRSQILFRTYRATNTALPGHTSRLLTTIHYTSPSLVLRDTAAAPVRDDTTYLFLEDRSAGRANPLAPSTPLTQGAHGARGKENEKAKEKEEGIETDGFEIMDIPPDTPAPGGLAGTNDLTLASSQSLPADPQALKKADDPLPKSALTPMAKGTKGVYRMIAVKPSGNVLPLLQNLLSPLVMGLTKSARAAASTTAQTATPTPLPGTPFTITSLTLPPLSPPNPNIIITIHALNSTPSSMIFLEADWPGQKDATLARQVLEEVLTGCIPENGGGELHWHEWVEDPDTQDRGGAGWEGAERTRRMTMLLARCLREATYI